MEWLSISYNGWCACSGEPNSLLPLFHSNQHRDINTAEYPQTAESLFLRGNFQLLGANTFHYLGSHCSQNGLSKWQRAPGKSRSLHFSEKQRALIILWRTLDNKFAIKMNPNGGEGGRKGAVLKHFLPPLLLLVLSRGAPGFGGLASLPLCLPWSSLWSHQKLTVARFSCKFSL